MNFHCSGSTLLPSAPLSPLICLSADLPGKWIRRAKKDEHPAVDVGGLAPRPNVAGTRRGARVAAPAPAPGHPAGSSPDTTSALSSMPSGPGGGPKPRATSSRSKLGSPRRRSISFQTPPTARLGATPLAKSACFGHALALTPAPSLTG